MGRSRNLSRDLHREVGESDRRPSRVREENAGYLAPGHRYRKGAPEGPPGLAYCEETGETYDSVFHALFDDPVEATNLLMRSDLMIAIRQRVSEWGMTQKEAAERLGITQPRLNRLLKGNIDDFSLDALVALLKPAGLWIEFRVKGA